MIGSLISAGLGLASSIYGGIKASQAMKNVKANLEEQQKRNEDWYNRRYNEDVTQRADTQRLLTIAAENIKNRNRGAAGRAAVMGGSQAALAAERAANNQTLADITGNIAANADERRDRIEQQYQQRQAGLESQLNQLESNKANAITQAVTGAASSLGEAGGAVDDLIDNYKKTKNNA